MYYEHFGLDQAPFKITPNTDFFFTGGNRGPVLEALTYAITHGEGIVKVSGEVGSGKTMLCNMLQSQLPDNVESVYLANPSVAPEEVLHAIAFELQLGVDRGADRLEVMHVLQNHLVQQHAEGKRIVVFIEESQSMPLATLEEIRLLSNLETRTDKLLQIVLFGQPELDDILRRPDIRQLRDRIVHSFRLEPLTSAEVQQYLLFRLRAAGYRGPSLFSPKIVKQIAEASGGLTRRINLLADKALLAAFSENTHAIQKRHIQAALRDSEFSRRTGGWRVSPHHAWAGAALLAGTALCAALYIGLEQTSSPEPPRPFASASETAPSHHTSRAPPSPTSISRSLASERAPSAMADPLVPDKSVSSHAPLRLVPVSTSRKIDTPNLDAQSPRDIVSARIAATPHWVSERHSDSFSIQLFIAESETHLRNHLKKLPKYVDIDDIYMYRGVAQGRLRLNVLWGSYRDRAAAEEWLNELPPSLRIYRPYVRTMKAIRADMERNNAQR